ncbi:MAG TPA: hypothetical protein VHT75_07135 [Acidimicrobiales bacterium]|jgi:hypothetical protein|nr:hypothetical protein [Acidimicrobiales bacterium]
MLSSIHPLGERSKGNRWWLTVAAHVVGGAAGGAAIGAALGFAGSIVPSGARWAVAGLAVAAAASDLGMLPQPSWRRQVDERWLQLYRGWVYGIGYGFQLGMGLVTIVTTATVYVVFAVAVFAGSGRDGALLGALFGATRGATVLAASGVRTTEGLRRFHQRLTRTGRRTRWLAPTADLLVAASMVAALRS